MARALHRRTVNAPAGLGGHIVERNGSADAPPYVVIGGGPAGIGAGLALGAEGIVLEEATEPGGLCRTIEFEGAVFDWGGHSFHTPHPEIRRLVFESLDMYEQPRQAVCFSGGTLLPYPFQANFHLHPDPEVVRACAEGLRVTGGAASNFDEWIDQKFGVGIARHFLRPYNEKLWGPDLRRLTVDWVGERVAGAEGGTFARSGGRRTPLGADTTVAYPARGGFGEIVPALARRLARLELGQKVVRIDPLRRELVTARGAVWHWRGLVSSLPLDRLFTLLSDVPPRLVRAAATLQALPLALVLVVVGHPVDTNVQRIYCPGDEIPSHKIVVNHNSSPSLRSLPRHGILAEVSAPASLGACDRDLQERVLRGLCRIGLLRSLTEVHAARVILVPRGYPVPTRARDATVREMRDWLAERQIYPVGRFGEWAYINSDEALHRGLRVGERLLGLVDC